MSKDLTIKDEKLMEMYSNSVDVGTTDAGEAQAFPLVKITSSMSKENILANGKKSEIGKLYHNELKVDLDKVEANICYIGKYMLPDFNKPKIDKMTYVFGAVKKDDNTPFVMFVKGYSLQKVWELLKEVSTIKTRYKLPMYAINMVISVGQRSHAKFKTVDVFNFEIVRDNDGLPDIEKDVKRAESLMNLVERFKESISQMVKQEEEPDEYSDQANELREDIKEQVVEAEEVDDGTPPF